MLDIGCLVKNTSLRNNLNDLVEFIAYSRVSKNLDAGLQSIYNDIRSNGIEVDLQTIGFIYNDVLPKSYAQFDSDHDVNEYALKSYTDAINRAARLEAPEPVELQIGQNSPDIEVVNGILNMFTKLNTEPSDPIYSDMRMMQEALWKGIQRKLNLTNSAVPKDQKDWEELLTQALGYEQLGMQDINGRLNGIDDLFNSMKDQLDSATQDMEAKGDYATAQKWKEMTGKLKAASYSLLFSKGEAKSFITTIMKEAGYAKELKTLNPDGTHKTVIDWNKLSNDTGSVLDLHNNIDRVMRAKNYSDSVIDAVQDSFVNEVNDMNAKIVEWRLKQMENKSEALNRASNKKTDLKRLAELNNLGIFQSAHDKLLSSVIGISDLQAQDLQDLENLAKAASDLYREIDKTYGDDIFASSALQTIQRHIDRIVQRNINNKTVLMRVMSAIKNFVDVLMTGMLMGPLTILENWLSGFKETMVPIWGKSKITNAEDRQIYQAMLLDVFSRGQAYGEEVGSFAPRELYSNSLRFKWKDSSLKEKGESILYLAMAPARIGLLGFDSANKAVITNKTFHNSMYQALLQHGKTEEEAKNILNEALHGQKYEDAKTNAADILNSINTKLGTKYAIPVNNSTITRLANDLVKANLNTDGLFTDKAKATEIVVSTLKGSYHVAGYGLGHEPNNFVSKAVKGLRDEMVQKEQKLRTAKKWNSLAWTKLGSTFMNGMVIRFIGGATNWVVLRAQSGLGLGLATGFLGKWNDDIDFKNADTIKQSIKEMQGARNQIGRGLSGIAYTAIGYALMYAATQGGDDDRERKKKRLQELNTYVQTPEVKEEIKQLTAQSNIYKQIKSNYEGNRLFKKLSPDLMLLNYYMQTDNNHWRGALNYVINTTGIASDFSTAGKFTNAMDYFKKGEVSQGKGELASIAGDRLSVPLWRAYKEWWKLGNWIVGNNVSSDFKKPSNVSEGLFGGGAMEDWGVFQRNSSITILPGIGPKSIERFKTVGVENMNDLEKNPGWENSMYINEKGNPEFILDAGDRKAAKEAAEKWMKEN